MGCALCFYYILYEVSSNQHKIWYVKHYNYTLSENICQVIFCIKTHISVSSADTDFNGAELRIEKGDFVSLMGASGSGKSTLLYLIV